MTDPSPKKAAAWPLVIITLLLAAAIGLPMVMRAGGAELTGAFSQTTSLGTAIDRAEENGRPVLALVTSDTCPACTRLKRYTLSDSGVDGFVRDRFSPVHVNESVNLDDARRLPYRYLPTTLVIRDGVVVARLEGYRPVDEYLGWLRTQAGDHADARVIDRAAEQTDDAP